MDKLNVIDLFCGCGGMSKGLTDAGLDIIAGIDFWDKAVNSYNKNFTHKAYCQDLTKFTPEMFNELYNPENKQVDLLVGGPPCQSFSMAGKRKVDDPKNNLFLEYVKYLDYFKPKAFIMENVIGILSKKNADGDKVIDLIMKELRRDYNCMINKLYASDFEVPQNRRRVIIIGIRKDLNILPTAPETIIKNIEDRITVNTVLLPREHIADKYYLSEVGVAGAHRRDTNGKGFSSGVLKLDKPSHTITSQNVLLKYNDTDIRRLTPLEVKRIQSFPDDYIIEGSYTNIQLQIGNAVPCKLAYHLGKYIINRLKQ